MILIEKTYLTDLEKLWKAISDKGEMKKWYFDIEDFKLEIGHEFNFWAGPPDEDLWHHRCVIKECVPTEKLVYSWTYPGYEGESILSWQLSKVDESHCKLILTHEFPIAFDESVEALKEENFQEGWTYILSIGLKEYLED